MNCNHTTLESCLRGDECAQCLRDELSEAREIAKKYEDRFFITDHELAEALKRADAEYSHAKSLQETINLLNVANKVAEQDAKAMERRIAVLQVENDRLTQEVAARGSASVMGNPMTKKEKLEWCIRALDSIACDYEWMKRKDMIERAGRTLCDVGAWRKVSPGQFARHGDSPDFRTELSALINKHSMENGSNTPDFILNQFLADVLMCFNRAVLQRERWYGRPEQVVEIDENGRVHPPIPQEPMRESPNKD